MIIFLYLLFCTVWAHAVVSPGGNIWQMVKDVGQQTDTIATLVAALGNNCSSTITQADITAGIYTISQPGYYCLGENVVGTNNPMISIQTSNVILDLGNNTMTGDGTNNAINFDVTNLSNIAVRNGNIRTCANGIDAFTIGIVNYILCEDLTFNDITNVGIWVFFGSNVRINYCNFINCLFSGNALSVNNLVAENCYVNAQSLPSLSTFQLYNVSTFYINNCIFNRGDISLTQSHRGYIGNLMGFNDGSINSVISNDSVEIVNCSFVGAFSTATLGTYVITNITAPVLDHNVSINTRSGGRGILGGSLRSTIRNCITMGRAAASSIGIQGGSNSQCYANISHGFVTNYSGITIAPVVVGPTTTTMYWVNVS